jgi:hypothetical protein
MKTCKICKCYEMIVVVNTPPILLISFVKKMELWDNLLFQSKMELQIVKIKPW